MVPDIDLLLGVLEIQHRTITHSVVFWSVAFIPFFVKYRQAAVPYFVAAVQHILLGDLVVGRTDILWPIADVRLGLGLSLLSPISLALEAAGLALLLGIAYKAKEPKRASPALTVLVIFPLAAFVLLASLGDILPPIFLEGTDARYLERDLPRLLSSPNMQIAILLHIGLIAFILISSHRFSRNERNESRRTAKAEGN
jgi:membrane-bound metal-dependent hydrolase YbcI (DUF457 family)